MAENKGGSRVNAHYIIPDDPENSTYRFIIVSAKRARQIQGGQRSFLPTMSRNPTDVAKEETRSRLVQYQLPCIPQSGA
ncbi:MAG: DNA-directed RNA polymerase subunit omega [Acidobacteriota bacterium]